MDRHYGVISRCLLAKPKETVCGGGIFRTFQRFVKLIHRWVLAVMPLILPSHKIDYLRKSTGDGIKSLYVFKGIIITEKNLRAALPVRTGKMKLHHHHLRIVEHIRTLGLHRPGIVILLTRHCVLYIGQFNYVLFHGEIDIVIAGNGKDADGSGEDNIC